MSQHYLADITSSHYMPEFLELEYLRRKIRRADEPDNPMLIQRFLELDTPEKANNSAALQIHLKKQCLLLLDTIVDDALAPQWRENCLNVIYCLLSKWQALAQTLPNNESGRAEVNAIITTLRNVKICYSNALNKSDRQTKNSIRRDFL
ncbi:hypothetical protein TDB9533_00370 [Thalassocella blandensis]|nr:hypothetical protein TDB9533_00370 [Thalassocella blandensis]